MKALAIEGINGAGKSPTIAHTIEQLGEQGQKSACFAPFHLVRPRLDRPDIYPLWDENPSRAVELLHETLDEVEDQARQQGLDVLLYDRHWMTVHTQAPRVPEVIELWGDRFVPTVLLTAPVEHSMRLTQRGYTAPWLQDETIPLYTRLYDELYSQHPDHMLGRFMVESQTQDLRPIATTIVSIISQMEDNHE